MRTVVIPEGPKYIQQNAFRNCSSLCEAYIPDSVEEIAGNAFADTPLFRMTAGHYIVGRFLIRADGYSPIPIGVRRIGPRAFERGGLRNAVIPEGVISIGDNAFANCGVLTDVSIPSTVTQIGVDAFAYTPWLSRRAEPFTIVGANILLHANPPQTEVDVPIGVRCIASAAFAQLPVRAVRLPEGLHTIQHGAFSFCEQLEYIELPGTLRTIEGYAFHSCSALHTVKLHDGLSKIGHAMFSNCVALKSIRLPSTLTEIDNEAFYHAGLREIIIPEGVTRIGRSAFSHCAQLADIFIPASVTQIEENAFTDCPKFRLHAEEGSFAERYAKQNNMLMQFVKHTGEPPVSFSEPVQQPQRVAPPVPQAPVQQAAPSADPDFLFRPVAPQPEPEQAPVKKQPAPKPEPEIKLHFVEPKATEKPKAVPQPEPAKEIPREETAKSAAVAPEKPKKAVAPKPVESPSEAPATAATKAAEAPTEEHRPKYRSFDEEEEINYAERIKRELEEARKKSVPVDPNAKLPQLEEEPEPKPAPKQPKEKAKKPKKAKTKPERELSPEEAKAKRRASLLDDLPDLPEDRERKQRMKESPEERKARMRASLLDDLPDLPDLPDEPEVPELPKTKPAAPEATQPQEQTAPAGSEEGAADDDPFANIHWNEDQSTFTIRL